MKKIISTREGIQLNNHSIDSAIAVLQAAKKAYSNWDSALKIMIMGEALHQDILFTREETDEEYHNRIKEEEAFAEGLALQALDVDKENLEVLRRQQQRLTEDIKELEEKLNK